jgi:hypothetical protein
MPYPAHDAAWTRSLGRDVATVVGVHAVAAAACLLVWPDFATLVRAVDHGDIFQQDFVHYHVAGARVLHEPLPHAGYFYPASFALLMAPLGALPIEQAAQVWIGMQALAWLSFVLVVARGLAAGRVALTSTITAGSYPMLHNLKWGQVSVMITLGCVAMAVAAQRRRPWSAGAALGVVTAVKYYPAWLAVWLALRRDVRALLAGAIAVAAFGVGLPCLLLGVDEWLAYDTAILRSARDASWVAADLNSQHFAHVVGRWRQLAVGAASSDVERACLRGLGVAVAVACAWLARRRMREGEDALALTALVTAWPFLVATSWPHYFVALIPCQVALIAAAARTARPRAVVAAALLSIALASLPAFALAPSWAEFNGWGLPFLANGAALAGVFLARARA